MNKITLQLTPEQAERLKWAVEAGALADFGEVEVAVCEPDEFTLDVPGPAARIAPPPTEAFYHDYLLLIGVVNGPNLATIGPAVDRVAKAHEELLSAWCGFLPITFEEPSLMLVKVAEFLTTFVIAESYKVASYKLRGDRSGDESVVTVGNDAAMKVLKRCFTSSAPFNRMTYGALSNYVALTVENVLRDYRAAQKADRKIVRLTDGLDVRPRTYAPHKRYQKITRALPRPQDRKLEE